MICGHTQAHADCPECLTGVIQAAVEGLQAEHQALREQIRAFGETMGYEAIDGPPTERE